MATSKQQAALYKEGRLELAIQAFKNSLFQSYRAAVKAYDVSQRTLKHRLNGIPAQPNSNLKKHLFIPTEEESLTE